MTRMKKLEKQYKTLADKGKQANLDFKKSAEEIEDKLRLMGIELPLRGPRIPDPAHTRGVGRHED